MSMLSDDGVVVDDDDGNDVGYVLLMINCTV